MSLKGAEIIGSFNINDNKEILDIKMVAVKFIDTVKLHCPSGRRSAIAITHIEEAAMMAVKAFFEDGTGAVS